MCPCFYLNNFHNDTNNLWVLGRLCAARRGDTGATGDPLLEKKLLLLCGLMTVYHGCSSLPIYLIFPSWHFKKDPNVWKSNSIPFVEAVWRAWVSLFAVGVCVHAGRGKCHLENL